MNPDVLQFQCGACQSVLTVPVHLAGVTGPCPMCGQSVTSPQAAPQFASAPSFGGMQPQQSPAQPPMMPQASAQVPVMPLPQVSQHLNPGMNPMLGGQMPVANIPQRAPEPAPSWQSPGLGQTILEASTQNQPPMQGGFLPPRRAEGQPPLTGSLTGAPPAPGGWGSGLQVPSSGSTDPLQPQSRGSGMSGHSGLIPGSPTLPLMGGAGSNSGSFDGNSLLGRSLPNAPQGSSASMPLDPSQRMATQNLPPAPVSPRSRSLKKPKRTSNVFMIALAVLFLAGFLAAVGWLFREPVMQLVERYLPAKVELVAEVSESPMAESQKELQVASRPVAPEKPAPQPPVEATAKTAESSTPKTASSFDPMESAPTPPKAQAASSEEILAATSAMKPTQEPKLPTATVTEPTQGTALVEVAPKAVPAGTQEATSKENTLDMQERKEVRLEVPEEAKPAAVALQKFFDAANMEERLALTLAPDAMKPIMERYYSVNKDGPIRVDAIGLVRYDPKPQLGGGAHAVFGVESKTWEFPVPVMLEQSGGKFKVDWLSFIEFKDRLLEKYLHTYQEGPARFHVGITRTHYFEDKVPNASSRWAFRISPAPPNPFLATIFVDKESVLGRELQTSIPWGAQVWAIFELEWRKLGTQAWVELSAVPQLNWYSVPSAPKAVRSIPSSSVEMPTETQKAVPVGR